MLGLREFVKRSDFSFFFSNIKRKVKWPTDETIKHIIISCITDMDGTIITMEDAPRTILLILRQDKERLKQAMRKELELFKFSIRKVHFRNP